ncbi:hypothetical protein [Algoriphagus sp.]|uniref:hypothetical protein n=1 Tax=Algoriphagus sp. TaxID=1872435 RepID=UPI00272F853D|nr:hypothetical protein [Algoriphagus sp.]MDP2039842.1 hypothetical protein [Algoriphagus sp.]
MHKVSIPEGTDLNALAEALQSPQANNQSKRMELLRQAKIDPNKPLSLPPVCLSVIGSDGKEGIIGSLGDFSLVIGKAKSKKTFCVSMFLASLAKNGLTQERIKGELPTDKKRVIFFDTEQSVQNPVKLTPASRSKLTPSGRSKLTPGRRSKLTPLEEYFLGME